MKKLTLISATLLFIISCSKDSSTPAPVPVASFTYSIDKENTKTIYFSNASHNIITSTKYTWTFGDGNTSSDENPSHTYSSAGSFNVVLKVSTGDRSDCSVQKIIVPAELVDSTINPNVSFLYSQNKLTVFCQNTSIGINNLASYQWNFGDGESINTENPSHTYKLSGYYNIVLKVTQYNKSYVYTKGIYVSTSDNVDADTLKPMPSFSYTIHGNTVYFANTSSLTNSATKYAWNFGDNTTSVTENPIHDFANGSYNVVLKVSNQLYTEFYTTKIKVPAEEIPVIDQNLKPEAKFVFSKNGTKVYFQNASSNVTPETKYFWTFGDGTFSDIENPPFHTFIAGKYSVVLKVTNGNISASYYEEVNIP